MGLHRRMRVTSLVYCPPFCGRLSDFPLFPTYPYLFSLQFCVFYAYCVNSVRGIAIIFCSFMPASSRFAWCFLYFGGRKRVPCRCNRFYPTLLKQCFRFSGTAVCPMYCIYYVLRETSPSLSPFYLVLVYCRIVY